MAKVDELSALESRHKSAASELSAAESAVVDLAESVDETERDILQRQRNLKAFRDPQSSRRQRLLDSVEFENYNPVHEEAEIHRLLTRLKELQASLTDAQSRLEKARAAERDSFYKLAKFRHESAVIDIVRTEIAMFSALRAESLVRADAAAREGVSVGPIQHMGRVDFGSFDIHNPQSAVCHRVRVAIAAGYLDGSESFLKGVAFRESNAA